MKTIICLVSLILVGTKTEAQIYYFQDMSTVEIAALDKEKTIVLLPGGILEQHGLTVLNQQFEKMGATRL